MTGIGKGPETWQCSRLALQRESKSVDQLFAALASDQATLEVAVALCASSSDAGHSGVDRLLLDVPAVGASRSVM